MYWAFGPTALRPATWGPWCWFAVMPGFEEEFVTVSGETVAVETLPADAVRELHRDEIAHARLVVV